VSGSIRGAIAPIQSRRDGCTVNVLRTMKTNSDTALGPYIGLDVHKEKNFRRRRRSGLKRRGVSPRRGGTTRVALDRLIRRIAKTLEIPVSRISVIYRHKTKTVYLDPDTLLPVDLAVTDHFKMHHL